MRQPEFLTFVGPDESTDIDGLADLQRHYPVEFGIKLAPGGKIHRFDANGLAI